MIKLVIATIIVLIFLNFLVITNVNSDYKNCKYNNSYIVNEEFKNIYDMNTFNITSLTNSPVYQIYYDSDIKKIDSDYSKFVDQRNDEILCGVIFAILYVISFSFLIGFIYDEVNG